MTPQKYHMLVADVQVAIGDLMPNMDNQGRPLAAHQTPRSVEICSAFEDRIDGNLVRILTAGDDLGVRVLQVDPVGAIIAHTLYHDRELEVDAHVALEAEGGWRVQAIAPLHTIFGPQGELIFDAMRTGIDHLESAEKKATADAYDHALAALYAKRLDSLETARLAAETALWNVHADGTWWTGCVGNHWGDEILALAARDLINDTAGWDQAAYNLLTLPWRTALPNHPLHPADQASLASPFTVKNRRLPR